MFDPSPDVDNSAVEVLNAFKKGVADPTQLQALTKAGQDALIEFRRGFQEESTKEVVHRASIGGRVLNEAAPLPMGLRSGGVGNMIHNSPFSFGGGIGAVSPFHQQGGGGVINSINRVPFSSGAKDQKIYNPSTGAVGLQALELLKNEMAQKVLEAFRSGVTDPAQLKQITQAGHDALMAFRKEIEEEPIQEPPQKKTLGGRILSGTEAAYKGVSGGLNALSLFTSTVSPLMRQGAGMVNTINNASLSGSQRDQRLVDSIPIVGELVSSFRELRDAVDGTTERMRMEGIEQQNRLMREQNRAAREGELEPRRMELAAARNAAGVLAGAAPSAYAAGDRSTGRGAIDYEISQQRLTARDAIDAAGRRVEISRRDVASARERLPGIDAQIRRAEQDRTAAARDVRAIRGRGSDVTSSRNRADEIAALNRVEEANQRIINLNAQRRTASENLSRAEIQNANDLSAARQRNIDQLRTEMQILQQRERSMSATAQRFGMATEFEQDVAIQFAEIARTEGIGALLPEQRQMVQQYFPQFASGELERFGEQSRGYRYGRDVLGEFGTEGMGQSLADTRSGIDQLQTEVRNNIIIDERELANQIAASLGPAMERLVRTIESEARARTSEMVRGRLITTATGGS